MSWRRTNEHRNHKMLGTHINAYTFCAVSCENSPKMKGTTFHFDSEWISGTLILPSSFCLQQLSQPCTFNSNWYFIAEIHLSIGGILRTKTHAHRTRTADCKKDWLSQQANNIWIWIHGNIKCFVLVQLVPSNLHDLRLTTWWLPIVWLEFFSVTWQITNHRPLYLDSIYFSMAKYGIHCVVADVCVHCWWLWSSFISAELLLFISWTASTSICWNYTNMLCSWKWIALCFELAQFHFTCVTQSKRFRSTRHPEHRVYEQQTIM